MFFFFVKFVLIFYYQVKNDEQFANIIFFLDDKRAFTYIFGKVKN